MVVTLAPSTCQAKTVQDFTALPSTCTTQAPHCEVSQPTWVPVSRRCSRRYCTRSVRGSTSSVTALPFTVRETAVMGFLLELGQTPRFSHRPVIPAADRGKIPSILPGLSVLNKVNSEPPPRGRSRALPTAGRHGRRPPPPPGGPGGGRRAAAPP